MSSALTPEALRDFELIWRRKNAGKEITPAELQDKAERVLRAIELTYRPIPIEKKHIFDRL